MPKPRCPFRRLVVSGAGREFTARGGTQCLLLNGHDGDHCFDAQPELFADARGPIMEADHVRDRQLGMDRGRRSR